MKAYKGFDKNMQCRGFQYEEGREYHEDFADLCNVGFHACERPLDCFGYYSPADSAYREVELDDVSEQTESYDTKRVGKTIRIGAALDIAGLCKAQFEYVKAHTTEEHTDPKMATAGYRGAATAGYRGAATAGECGAATSRGSASVGKNGIACVRGDNIKVRGGMGALLVIGVEESTSYDLAAWKVVVVDGETVKADTWYTLKDGELVEADGE